RQRKFVKPRPSCRGFSFRAPNGGKVRLTRHFSLPRCGPIVTDSPGILVYQSTRVGRWGVALVTRHLLATVAFGALLAGSAAAADLSVRPQPYQPMPIYRWSGLYVGGHVGGAWLRASQTFINNSNLSQPLSHPS